RLARTYCSACHAFPAPELLDKSTWRAGVLPQMARRLGAGTPLLSDPTPHPHMTVLTEAVSERDWEAIERYYLEQSPDTLPPQRLPAPPQVDPGFFRTGPFVPRAPGAAIITVLETDSTHNRIFVGEAGSRRLLVFDWSRRLLASLALGSPATDVIARDEDVLVLESGILHPNDEPRGRLARYRVGRDSLEFREVLIDSLLRPVFVAQADFDADGRVEFLICEYGDNRGRLALYRERGSGYTRVVLDASPGAIRFEIRDLTADGHPDVVALFAQGDERIVLFVNDGHGGFAEEPRVLARFPPVYGSMHFSMHDFNGDGRRDILYVNGDNFDLSRVLKPYHGIRILENDGNDRFVERYFFPVYGAARAEAADFDRDGDPDIVITSNFADADRHPERGIMFLEHTGPYQFAPYAFSIAARNRWNVMTTGDLNRDGWLDVIVGAMDLESIANIQRRRPPEASDDNNVPLLWFENRMQGRAGAPR
ncbi:MAG: FG-GAP repeat domain-containing protein, partial [Gemmatimonadales bacterium]